MSYVAVSERGCAGQEWRATSKCYEALLHAFESGAGLLTFVTLDGADVTVRSCDVVSLSFMSDTTLAAIRERERREVLS